MKRALYFLIAFISVASCKKGHDDPTTTSTSSLPTSKWTVNGKEYSTDTFAYVEAAEHYNAYIDTLSPDSVDVRVFFEHNPSAGTYTIMNFGEFRKYDLSGNNAHVRVDYKKKVYRNYGAPMPTGIKLESGVNQLMSSATNIYLHYENDHSDSILVSFSVGCSFYDTATNLLRINGTNYSINKHGWGYTCAYRWSYQSPNNGPGLSIYLTTRPTQNEQSYSISNNICGAVVAYLEWHDSTGFFRSYAQQGTVVAKQINPGLSMSFDNVSLKGTTHSMLASGTIYATRTTGQLP